MGWESAIVVVDCQVAQKGTSTGTQVHPLQKPCVPATASDPPIRRIGPISPEAEGGQPGEFRTQPPSGFLQIDSGNGREL